MPNIKTVLVRNQQQIFISQTDPALIQSLINLNSIEQAIVDNENIKSVLLDKNGNVLHKTENNIGLKVRFFENESSTYREPEEGDEIYHPLKTVVLEMPDAYLGSGTITDSDGKYDLIYLLPPCPGFTTSYSTPLTLNLYYKNFNPRSGSTFGMYHLTKPGYDYCSGLSANPPGMSLGGLMSQINAAAIEATLSNAQIKQHFMVDTVVIGGEGFLSNEKVAEPSGEEERVPLGPTTHQYERPESDFEPMADYRFDFDGDDEDDIAKLGKMVSEPDENGDLQDVFKLEGETGSCNGDCPLQGIYLSSGSQDPNSEDVDRRQPDFIRLADKLPDFEDQGLLESISEDDFKNTDILVFRESNGMLITKKRGLDEFDYRTRQRIEFDDEAIEMAYSIMVRGPNSAPFDYIERGSRTGTDWYSAWQSDAEMNPELHARKADHIRPQEQIRVIAINRKTGYIGTVRTTYGKFISDGMLSMDIDKIVMRPPNLKIIAEREYTVEKGITSGQGEDSERKYLIGYEGAALASDRIIKITTEWFDHDGSPLPEEMEDYGYTGRLAKIISENTLGEDGEVGELAHFPVKPGRHTEQIQLGSDATKNEHYYLQVHGECENECGEVSFASGEGTGRFQHRPNNFVPVLTPIMDETLTLEQYRAYRRYQRDNPGVQIEKPEPLYQWVYRPELQFSLYALEMKNIFRNYQDEDASTVNLDVYREEYPFVLSTDNFVEVMYSLLEEEVNALAYLGVGQELVFSLGEEEIVAIIGEDGQITFKNLEHLANLEIEDFLSLRLYSNSDSANILWEFGIYYLGAAVDLNRDGLVEFTSEDDSSGEKLSDKTTKLKPFRFWVNDDFDVVNDNGNIDIDVTSCNGQELIAIQVCEQWDELNIDGINPPTVTNISDGNLDRIETERDLEDFAPLAISISAPRDSNGYIKFSQGETVTMKAKGFSINLFKGVWDEGDDYLTKTDKMNKQVNDSVEDLYLFALKKDDAIKELDQEELNKMFGKKGMAHLIFEGIDSSSLDCYDNSSECYLEISINIGNRKILSEKVYMNILPITYFYEHYTIGKGNLTPLETPARDADYDIDYKNIFIDEDPEYQEVKDEYLLMVHGWRMQYNERVSFAETAFKRLYWSGHKGKFGFFSWPTGYFDSPAHLYGEAQLDIVKDYPANYANSEILARLSGIHLMNHINKIDSDQNKKVHIFAHSMGNVVVSEALRISPIKIVEQYIPSQAAEVASAYFPRQPWLIHTTADLMLIDDPEIDETYTFTSVEAAWRFYNGDGLDTEYDMPPNYYSYTGIPDLHGPTTPQFELQTAQAEGWGRSYFADISVSAGQIINFYNPLDAALSGWESGQLTKPDFLGFTSQFTWRYDFDWDCIGTVVRCTVDPFPDQERGDQVSDIYLALDTDTFPDTEIPLIWQPPTQNMSISLQSVQILGHIIPTRTDPLGQVPATGTGSVINDFVVFNFGSSNQGHSAQFYSNYKSRSRYWKDLLANFGY